MLWLHDARGSIRVRTIRNRAYFMTRLLMYVFELLGAKVVSTEDHVGQKTIGTRNASLG